MRYFFAVILIAIFGSMIFAPARDVRIVPADALTPALVAEEADQEIPVVALDEPLATSTPEVATSTLSSSSRDLPRQSQLPDPPSEVRGLYVTGWIGGIPKRIDALIDLAEKRGLNAFVVDVKDYSGYVSYVTGIPEVKAAGAEKEIRIPRPNALIKQLHDRGMYVIARISVFQDTILAEANPEWALKRTTDGRLWRDQKGLAWMDPAEKKVWAYNLAIAKDALDRGFDEINFDYIRFPTDGSLKQISYPAWNEETPRHEIIADFFEYLNKSLPQAKISADLFGLVTVDKTDLGIGQLLEDSLGRFDAVAPMIYPSHFANGFQGYKNPAAHPYEVVSYAMSQAALRFKAWEEGISNKQQGTGDEKQAEENAGVSSTNSFDSAQDRSGQVRRTKLRPWLQVFDLGATYDRIMIQKQIDGTKDALSNSNGIYGGYLLWDPKNTYEPLN